MTPSHQLAIGQILITPLANTPEKEIIHGGFRQTYRVLRQRIGRLGAALTAAGVGQGDVVAVMDWDVFSNASLLCRCWAQSCTR